MASFEGLYDTTYFIEDNKPMLLLFCRQNKKKVIHQVTGFYPFFYVTAEEYATKKEQVKEFILKAEDVNKPFVLDKNIKLKKLYLKNPYSMYEVKGYFDITFEGDLAYQNRFLIEQVDKLETTNYRLGFFDIETTSDKGFPKYQDPVENIISIGHYDNYDDKTTMWIWHKDYTDEIEEKSIEVKNTKNEVVDNTKIKIIRFPNEMAMLNSYLDYIQDKQPDFMIGWNVSFDINYLTARCERLGLPVYKLSPIYNHNYKYKKMKLVKWGKNYGMIGRRVMKQQDETAPKIIGTQYFDLLNAYKSITAQERESWKLDFIAIAELGIGKLDTHFDIGATWRTNPKYIEEYNYLDVYLIHKIERKFQIIKYFDSIKNTVMLANINDVFSSGKVLDNYILKKYRDKYILPSKVYSEGRETRIGGALVRQPKAGLQKNVVVVDFSGFYPNIMKTFNLSGERLLNEEILHFDPAADEVQELNNFEDVKPEYNNEKQTALYKIRTSKFSANLLYDVSEKGIMTQAVDELMTLRKEAKQELKKYKYGTLEYNQWFKIQQSYKFIINAAYGTSAYPGFRLFKLHNANAITGFARMLSKWVSSKLAEKGWETIGGDTDSLFLQLHSGELDANMDEINNQIFPVIKQAIDDFVLLFLPKEKAVHSLQMDMEKIYKTMLLLDVKKRYIGLLKYFDGQETEKLHFMGIDMKKSNTIKVCKEGLMELALAVLREQPHEPIMHKYYDLVKSSNDIDFFKIPSKLEKHQSEYKSNTPAVRATLWSNDNLKTQYRGGMKFYIVWVEEFKGTDVIAFDTKGQLETIPIKIDKNKYLDDLYRKFDNLIRSIPRIKNKNEEFYTIYKKGNHTLGKWL